MNTPMSTPLLDLDQTTPTIPRTAARAAPARRTPYTSAVLRLLRKREKDTLGRFYDTDGALHTIDAPRDAQLAHLMNTGLHDGTRLTAAGREAAAEINHALDRLAAGVNFDPSAIRPRAIQPQVRYNAGPTRSAETTAPRYLSQDRVTPAAGETETVWWGNDEIVFPGRIPKRYAHSEIDPLGCESMGKLTADHERPPEPEPKRIIAVATTEQRHEKYVWLSNGTAIGKTHLEAIAHEHGTAGGIRFTTGARYAQTCCAWTKTDDGRWRRLAIMTTIPEQAAKAARTIAARIDDWLDRLLTNH